MSKVLAITTKNLKEAIRNWKSVAIVFILPLVFMGIFALAFGDAFQNVYSLGVIKSDAPLYPAVRSVLNSITQQNSTAPLITVSEFGEEAEAATALADGKVTGYLKINDALTDFNLILSGKDQNSPALAAIVKEVVDGFTQREPSLLSVEIEEVSASEELSGFQFLAPGLIIYGIIIMITQVALEFSRIKEKGQVFRYFTSKTKSWQIILGYFLHYIVIGVIQVVILITSAMSFGMNMEGNPLDVFLLAIPTVFFTIGIGLIIGSLIDRPDPASNVATIIGIVLGFLSGAFIWTTRVVWLPTTQAAEGIIQIVQYGKGIADVTDNFFAVILGSILVLAMGTIAFQYKQLRGVDRPIG